MIFSISTLLLPQLTERHGKHAPVGERQHIPAGVEQHTGREIPAAAVHEPAEAPTIARSDGDAGLDLDTPGLRTRVTTMSTATRSLSR